MLRVRQIVNDIYASNTYVISDDRYDYCWLVDIGDFYKVKASISPNITIRGLFITHTHFDHIYGINELYMEYPQCKVYCSEYGKVALYDERKNFSKYHELPIVYNGKEVIALKDSDSLEIYPFIGVKAYFTPGHCPSCLTYCVGNWIFTGDAYIPGIKVVTNLPGCDKKQAQSSIEKIKNLSKTKTVCPGHGEIVFV